MADLDDFFAKKDRKKSKSTKKYATTEEVAKKLEDSAKKTEKLKKERVNEGEDNVTSEQVCTTKKETISTVFFHYQRVHNSSHIVLC